MLTLFHANEFKDKIGQMPLEDHVKESMTAQVDEFLAQLFEVANFDPESVRNSDDTSKFYSSLALQRV